MKHERAVLAGGCFQGMQDLIRRHDGVIPTRVGYTGGDVPNAAYRHQDVSKVGQFRVRALALLEQIRILVRL